MAKNKKQVKPQSKKAAVLIASVAAVLLIAAVMVLCLSGGGPVDKLQSAATKTLFAKNFTTQFTLDINGDPVDGIINAAIDPEARKLDVYMQLTTYASDYICGIYDGSFAVCTVANNKLRSTDISHRVDAFFDALEHGGKPDWSLLLDIDGSDLHGSISQSFDFDTLLTCLGDFLNMLNDADWAETYAGYSKDRAEGVTKYSFTPDPYVLVKQSLPCFEKAFLKAEDHSNLQAYIEDAKYLFKDGRADFSFGIRGGKLVSADFALQYHNTDISGSFSFIGIGSTIVDTETIAFYIEEAKNK